MRISPIYTPQNIISNPPHTTNHPMMEVVGNYMQEFKANKIGDKYIYDRYLFKYIHYFCSVF